MYNHHFGLKESPFLIAPDPRYLYMSAGHREAMAHLLFGLQEGGGFVQLTGEVGTGKTTLCRGFLDDLPDHANVAMVLNPRVNELELLEVICEELHIEVSENASIRDLHKALNHYLLAQHAQGRRTLVILEEAQNLSDEVFEQVRLLTNLETTKQKLLQIILIGQSELDAMLSRKELRQLSQRVTARYHLDPLNEAETRAYIHHRLRVAGGTRSPFGSRVIKRVHKQSKGVPRLINVICDRALLGAYAQGKTVITPDMISEASMELAGKPGMRWYKKPVVWGGVAAALSGMVLLPVAANVAGRFLSGGDTEINFTDLDRLGKNASTVVEAKSAGADQPIGFYQSTSVTTPPESQLEIQSPAQLQPEAQPPKAQAIKLAQADSSLAQDFTVAKLQNQSDGTATKTLNAWQAGLRDSPTAVDSAQSFSRLAVLWQRGSDVVTNCDSAAEIGLACVNRTGSWQDLVMLNRPAVLELESEMFGGKRYVLVAAIAGGETEVRFDGNFFDVPVSDLIRVWPGRFTAFWKPPPLKEPGITRFSSADDIMWLRRAVNILGSNNGGTPLSEPENTRFTENLRERIMDFQRSQQLAVSGIAGVDTLIRMNTYLHNGSIPKLYQQL